MRIRWWELLPEAVVAAGLTVFLVQETDAATSAFASTRAIVLMAVTGAAWLVARVVLARTVRWPLARASVFAVAAAAVLAVAVLPAYDDETVVETFPAAAPASMARDGANPPPPAAEAPAGAEPVRLATGRFRGVDHRAEGTVTFYRQPGGAFVVGLEDLDIQPGPDYDVYLVPGADREDRADGYVRVDDLRGNKGTQFYAVPAGIDITAGPWSLLVWCETFAVPIATATPVSP